MADRTTDVGQVTIRRWYGPTVSVSARSSPVRGACPGVADPMVTADGLLLRLRLPGGSIASSGVRTVADVADRFGSGVVELTSRGNLQIRGLDQRDVDVVAARLVASGLARSEPAGDERRNVVASPLTGHDPSALIDLSRSTRHAADLLAQDVLQGLPPKFSVVLDDGGSVPVRRVTADISFGAVHADGGEVMVQVELGRPLDDAEWTVACIPATDALRVMVVGARLCATHGERMAHLVERHGRADLVATMTGGAAVRWENAPAPSSVAKAPIGVLASDGDRVSIGAAPLLGRTSPEMLRAVADLADATSSLIRLTPWRGLVLLGVALAGADRAGDELAKAGFSVDPADPAHLVSACTGLPGCQSARADTMRAAQGLLDGPSPIPSRVHLAGCEKRCGADAPVVLVADDHGSFGTLPS